MKNQSNKLFLKLFLLVALAAAAGVTSAANPHYDSTQTPVAGNTALPINVSATPQVKGGTIPPAPCTSSTPPGSFLCSGLSVGTFNALANAAFETQVFIEGLMLGNPDVNEPLESTLAIGANGTEVDLAVSGSTYVTDGLYSEEIVATQAGSHIPLCATNTGNIILCPTPPPPPPPPPNNVISGKVSYQCLDTYTWHPWPTPVDYHQGEAKLTFYFDAPTPVPLTIRMAFCKDNPTLQPGSGWYTDSCHGVPLIPNPPSGYATNLGWGNTPSNPGWLMNIPAGATTYSTPMPLFYAAEGSGNHFACFTKPSNSHPRRVERQELTRMKYLYLKDESPGNKIFRFTGQSYQYNVTKPEAINILQV